MLKQLVASSAFLHAQVVRVQCVAFAAGEALVEFVEVRAVAVGFLRLRVGGRPWLRRECGPVGRACLDFVRNAGLVDLDVELASHAPVGSPRVLDDPVVVVVVFAPAHDLDCMSAIFVARSDVVDAVVVRVEVFVHSEACMHRSVGHDLAFDGGDACEVGVRSDLEPDVHVGAVLTLAWTLPVVDSFVIILPFDWVRRTRIVDDSCVLEVVPRRWKVSSVATVVAGVAEHHVLWGQDCACEFAVFDACTVSQSAGGRESPA